MFRKGLSLQNVSETVVQEIKKLLLVHPMLVIVTKATILGDRCATNEVKWLVNVRPKILMFAVLLNFCIRLQKINFIFKKRLLVC